MSLRFFDFWFVCFHFFLIILVIETNTIYSNFSFPFLTSSKFLSNFQAIQFYTYPIPHPFSLPTHFSQLHNSTLSFSLFLENKLAQKTLKISETMPQKSNMRKKNSSIKKFIEVVCIVHLLLAIGTLTTYCEIYEIFLLQDH